MRAGSRGCLIFGAVAITALAGTAAIGSAAQAQPKIAPGGDPDLDPDLGEKPVLRPHRYPLAIVEHLSVVVPPMIYYWLTTPVQREDFEIGWDWASWRTKLTSTDAFILDTNDWVSNAVRHPLAGYLGYQVGRANGFEPASSVALTAFAAVAWEYLVEYQERISLNDLVVNSVSAFTIGEPLFRLGRLADAPGASWQRASLGLLASPFDRVHALAGASSWRAPGLGWAQLEASLGAVAGTYDGEQRNAARVALDLEVIPDRHYGRTGSATTTLGAGGWNRIDLDLRIAGDELSSARFATQTTYAGSYRRALDVDGNGDDAFFGAAAGVDYVSQRLSREWDHLFVMHLIGPRVARGAWRNGLRMIWELGAYADLGMTQAHVFGPVSPFVTRPQTSVIQSRGYYYASGVSVATRVRIDTPRWVATLEGQAFQLWSIDGLDRVEKDASSDDPHDVQDQRVLGRGAFGVNVGASVRLELGLEAALRRGTWKALERTTTDLEGRVDVVVGF
ncbi:MAG: DUF3943 domain-containing protein [Myxococcales bacterium]|nr:DUF3943 domain-containing protein [Myxococcales bacterium]